MTTSFRWRTEIWWFVVPLALCPAVALLQPGDPDTALARAQQLLAWQRSIGIAVEPAVHSWVAARPGLDRAVEVFYLAAHLSALIATALWLAVRRPAAYPRFRAAFASAQATTVAVYVLWPVAPLRMITGHPDDAALGWARSVQYELAAMPSGHVVFALLVGLAVWREAPTRWRWLGVAHPVLTVGAVVATAHHLLVDALAGAMVAVAAFLGAGSTSWHRLRSATAPAS